MWARKISLFREVSTMYKIVKRMIGWSGKYQKRIYVGFLLSFLTGIFISLPIVLAAMAIQAILGDMMGIQALTGTHILLFFLMLLAVQAVMRLRYSLRHMAAA